jgi:hypothetical protein
MNTFIIIRKNTGPRLVSQQQAYTRSKGMAYSFQKRSNPWPTLLLVGCSAALAGVCAALLSLLFVSMTFHSIVSGGPTIMLFSLAAALSAALLGPLLWWLLIIRPDQLTLGRGILVGILGSLVAHPLTWFLFMVTTSWAHATFNLDIGSPSPNDPEGFLSVIVFLSIYSLFLVGWLTTLIGGGVGAVLAKTVASRRSILRM